MHSHYRINVAYHGKHYFATAPESCTSRAGMQVVASDLIERFPASEGFEVTVTYIECVGQELNRNEYDFSKED